MNRLFWLLVIAALVLGTGGAFAQSTTKLCVPTGNGNGCQNVDSTFPLPTTATTSPAAGSTTTGGTTIAVTSTFQQVLAAATGRKSCLVQNTGSNTQYVYFGVIGSATLSNSFQVAPGQPISCATPNGVVLTDAVNITGTAGDAYVAASQ